MWVQREICSDLERICPQCLGKLRCIETLPQEQAVRAAAYLWEGCFQSSNDIWTVTCGGLLDQLPPEWLEAHITEILDCAAIDWADDFEFYNLCAALYHLPDVLRKILAYAEGKITADHARQWLPDMREMAGSQEHRKAVLEAFAQMDKTDLIGFQEHGSNENIFSAL